MIAHFNRSHARQCLHVLTKLRWEAVGKWAALILTGIPLVVSVCFLRADGHLQVFWAALCAFVLALLLVIFVSFWDWEVPEGLEMQLRALAGLSILGNEYHVFPNYSLPGENLGTSLLVLGPDQLCFVDLKSEPGRLKVAGRRLESHRGSHVVNLGSRVRHTRHKARRLRLHFNSLTATRHAPASIGCISTVTAFASPRRGPIWGIAGACQVENLPTLMWSLPHNLAPGQAAAILRALEAK